MQCGIERALLNLQYVLGDLLDTLGNGPAVLRLEGKRFQDEEIEGALWQIQFFGRHGANPFSFYRTIAVFVSRPKGRNVARVFTFGLQR